MRSTLILALVCVGVGGMLFSNARRQPAATVSTVKLSLVGEHNFAKTALDRTADVKRQVAERSEDDGRR